MVTSTPHAGSGQTGQTTRLLSLPCFPREQIFEYACSDINAIRALGPVSRLFNLQLREFLAAFVKTFAEAFPVSNSMIQRSGYRIEMKKELLDRLAARPNRTAQDAIEPVLSPTDRDYVGYRVYALFCKSVGAAVRSVSAVVSIGYDSPRKPEIVMSWQQMAFWEGRMQQAQESNLLRVWDCLKRQDEIHRGMELSESASVTEIRLWMMANTDLLQELSMLDFSASRPLMSVPFEMGMLKELRMLSFVHNNLQFTFPRVLSTLSNLRELSFERNRLHMIPPGSFDGLTGLVTLDLSFNTLTSIPAGVFPGMVSLTSLNLGENQLHAVDFEQFIGLPRLTHLSLFRNKLLTLPEDQVLAVRTLTLLDLGGNTDLRLSRKFVNSMRGRSSIDRIVRDQAISSTTSCSLQ